MSSRLQNLRWKLNEYKIKKLLLLGLKTGLIDIYNDELIEKLRNIYYCGIPASIILLSIYLSNGNCYDRALLLSRAFLDEEDDIKLICADIDNIKLNPKFISDEPSYAEHCFLERITKDGRHLIYDTSTGFVYDKKLYWAMEKPKIYKIIDKETIIKYYEENLEEQKIDYTLMNDIIIPNVELTYGDNNEIYAMEGILQREVARYKKYYDELNNKEYSLKK